MGLSEQEALTELLHCQDLYALQPQHLADYDLDILRVTMGDVLPKDTVDLVSPSFAEVLRHPCSSLFRSSAELLHLEESEGPITPYWDPTLCRDARQRAELFHKLADLKILSFRARARAFARLFLVKTKDGMIRLIVDARQANRYHARPPRTRLASSSALSDIDLSDECFLQTSGVGHISEIHLCGAGSDVRDGYFEFSNHRLAHYFALQFKVRVGDFEVTEVYDPETHGLIHVEPNDQVWPVVEAMPMGSFWAFHVCTDSLEHVVRIIGTGRHLVHERLEAPLMTVAEPVCSVYGDDINVHVITSESCDRRHEVTLAAFEARGFRFHEVSRTSQHHKQLGACFDGVARVLPDDPRRLWRVHLALRCLLRMGGAKPRVVRILKGHLVYIFSLARPWLSALHRLYRFQAHPLDRWRKFSPTDLAELRTLVGLVWLSEGELGHPCSHVVFCSDATLSRYCVQCTTASFEELKVATRFRERWLFRTREISPTVPIRHADEVARLGALSPLGGYSRDDPEEQESAYPTWGFGRSANFEEVMTAYGSWLDRQGVRTSRISVRASSPEAKEVEECVGAIRRLPATWGNPSRWHTVSKLTSSSRKHFA